MATFDGTTIERVRLALFKESGDDAHDDILGLLITEASAQVEAYIDRPFLSEARVDLHSVEDPRQLSIFLDAAPISVMTSLEYDSTSQFSGNESLKDADSYILDLVTGELRFRFQPSTGFQAWRVTYTAGLAADTGSLIAAYPMIARAVDLQVASLFHRIDDPQVESRSLGGAAIKVSEPMGLCKAAVATVGVHRMIRFPI